MVRFVVHPVSSQGPLLDSASTTVIAIIPARFASTRLPGKALADIGGRPMIEHVYRRASEARSVSSVMVATDDERIYRRGARVRRRRASHVSRTIPAARIVSRRSPLPRLRHRRQCPGRRTAHRAVDHRRRRGAAARAIPGSRCPRFAGDSNDQADIDNPNVTKVVVDRDGLRAVFLTRTDPLRPQAATGDRRHLGVTSGSTSIAARVLLRLASLPPTDLERAEALEQLRALEHGIRIKAIETAHDSIGVDTPEDLERVRRLVPAPVRT